MRTFQFAWLTIALCSLLGSPAQADPPPMDEGALRERIDTLEAAHAELDGDSRSSAQLAAELHALHTQYERFRYPRPEPETYSSPHGSLYLQFAPTPAFDAHGVDAHIVSLIDSAQRSLDLCVYELELVEVSHALLRAQQRGVTIRVVLDDRSKDEHAATLLEAHTIPLRYDERSALMHNKFLIVDNETVWCGSTNLSESGVHESDNNALTLHSPALAAQYTTEFEEMFVDNQFGCRSPSTTNHDWIPLEGDLEAQVYFAPEDNVMDRLVELVDDAEHSVRFLAFAYTSEPLCEAMLRAMERGVEVSGIFEAFHAGWRSLKLRPLHEAGASVRLDVNPSRLHHKVLIIDDHTVVTGSFNFSRAADRTNDENLLVLRGPGVAAAFGREFRCLFDLTDPRDPRLERAGVQLDDVAEHGDPLTPDPAVQQGK